MTDQKRPELNPDQQGSDVGSQRPEREPAEGRPMPELPPDQDRDADDGLPPEAVEEARRWEDVPVQDPEESTGIDAG